MRNVTIQFLAQEQIQCRFPIIKHIFKVAFLPFVNPASILQYLVSSSLFLPPSAELCETKVESVFCIFIISTSLSIFWGDPLKSHCSMAYPEASSFLKGFITSNVKINNYIFHIISFCLSNSNEFCKIILWVSCFHEGFITCCKSSVMSLQVALMLQIKCFMYPWDIFHMPVIKTVCRQHLGEETPQKTESDSTNLLSITFNAGQSNFFTTSGASR